MVAGKLKKKAKAPASPKLAPKASPKLAPKASPKLAPKASPKLGPKTSPKLAPKADPGTKRKKDDAAEPAAKKKKSGGDAVGQLAVKDMKELSEGTRKVLAARNIETLFEIQSKAFGPVFRGDDVVGRAKTGCGKTLAFVMPTVERILAQGFVVKGNVWDRKPLCVTVAPTRELARQIFTDYELVGGACGLRAKCFYGGTAFGPQCEDLRNGIDIVVATPGRLLDHIRRGTIDLSKCKMLVLDEADEMLNMGFQEDVETIMEALPKENLQKLLFSATLPSWVNALVSKHLKDPSRVDVTNDSDANATNSLITHQCVACPPQMRGDCIGDLCKLYAGAFGKTLVFTGTKRECDELASEDKIAGIGAAVLHGDVAQNQRETVMDNFRSGRVRCLLATDVAARGIDVPNVDLVVQTHPPNDLDAYVHRAGRTARAGRSGTCVTFYSIKEEYIIRLLEHKKGIKMQRVGPPQPIDVVKAAAGDAVKLLDHVHQDSADAFLDVAKTMIQERGAEEALSAALAAMTGHTRQLKGRSVLSAFSGNTALILHSEREIETTSKGWYLLRSMLYNDSQECKGLALVLGKKAVIFDVPDAIVPRVMGYEMWKGMKLEKAKELPELEGKEWDPWAAAQQLRDQRGAWRAKADQKKWGEKGGGGKDGGKGGKGGGFSSGRGGGGRGDAGGKGGGFRGRGRGA